MDGDTLSRRLSAICPRAACDSELFAPIPDPAASEQSDPAIAFVDGSLDDLICAVRAHGLERFGRKTPAQVTSCLAESSHASEISGYVCLNCVSCEPLAAST